MYSDVMLQNEIIQSTYELKKINYSKFIASKINLEAPILEVGPGNGEFLLLLSELGYTNVTSLDIDSNVIEKLAVKFPSYQHINSSVESHAEQYNLIILSHVLEHISVEHRIYFLNCLRERLLPGGTVLIELPNPLCFMSLAAYLNDPTHHMPISSSGLRNLLALTGYRDIKISSVKPRRKMLSLSRYFLLKLVGKILNLFSSQSVERAPIFYGIAKK